MQPVDTRTRMQELESRRTRFLQQRASAQRELRGAQRKFDRTDERLREVEAEIDMETIRSWGGTPDLAALLDAGRSDVFYEALRALAQSRGFDVLGQRTDTHQLCLGFGMDRGEIGGVQRMAEGIRYFAAGMKSSRGNGVCFNLITREEGCAYELRYRKRSGEAAVARMIYGTDSNVLTFPTLEAALGHIEKYLWCENVLDAEDCGVLELPPPVG